MCSWRATEGKSPMLRNIALKSLRDIRRGFLWWSLGLIGFVALIVSVYPTVHSNPSLNKLAEDYPEALQAFIAFGGVVDYSTAAGYLGIELFSLMVPLLLLVAAIGTGAGTIAGEEERGTLELLLANPVSRTKVVLEKTAALVLEVAGLGVVLWLALWVGALAADMDISAGHLAAATVSAVLLALAYGSIAILLGAATGKRTVAIGLTAAAAVAAYLVNGLAPLVDALEVPQKLSPFYHYAVGDPLRHGVSLTHLAVLIAIAVVATALAPYFFSRRDVAT
jgi:beta-exotoxin I transport system permease protein